MAFEDRVGVFETYDRARTGPKMDENEWERIATREYKEDNNNMDEWINEIEKPKKTGFQKFKDFITSKPSKESNYDKSIYKVRYEYLERHSSANSRTFCKNMMQRTANGVVYRLEDIDKASRDGVNKTFGHNGQAYDLFKYKSYSLLSVT